MRVSRVRFGAYVDLLPGSRTVQAEVGVGTITAIDITERGTIVVARATGAVELWPPAGTVAELEADVRPHQSQAPARAIPQAKAKR